MSTDSATLCNLRQRLVAEAKVPPRLRKLIAEGTRLAQTGSQPTAADGNQRQQIAVKLTAWLRDWRETARVLVTRRD